MSDIDQAAKGAGTAAAVTGTVVGITAAVAPAATAAAAVAIGAAIGTAIPIPLLGTAIGVIVGAFTALGIMLKQGLRDTFHPDAAVALAWLLLMQISPGFAFADVDTVTSHTGDKNHPAHYWAARVVRYLKLVAGIVPNPTGILYNPTADGYRANNLPTDTLQKNSYLEGQVPDASDPLTDSTFLAKVEAELNSGKRRLASAPSLLRTPAEAKAALGLLRGQQFAASGVLGWEAFDPSKHPDVMPDLRQRVKELRALAGESGPDAKLAALLGGDVTPSAPAKDPKVAGVGSGLGFGLGLVPGILLGGALLAGLVAGTVALVARFRGKRKA